MKVNRIVELAHQRNEFIQTDDGEYVFWPSPSAMGAYTEYDLKALAAELSRLNALNE
jgi:hypothetical protein